MTVDMSQFHQVFFEESFEGLDAMESGLLDLNSGSVDDETINTIFRAAHSIKGGSGTFGFVEIADFTHVLETLLDRMRSGKREINHEVVQMLLQSVDCLRLMMEAARDKLPIEMGDVHELQHKFEELLNAETVEDAGGTELQVTTPASNSSGWHINFHPHPYMLKTGNDPLRMFRELALLGQLTVKVDTRSLPSLTELDPEESYLRWELQLISECTEEQVREIFEWVDGDCELDITQLLHEESSGPGNQDNKQDNEEVRTGVDRRINSEDRRQQVEAYKGEERRSSTERGAETDRRTGQDRRSKSTETTSIRVGIDKIDALINMVGELVITQSMLSQFGEDFDLKDLDRLRDGLGLLERNTRELQESVMQIRMLPISFSFNRFPRLVHDLSTKLGKKVELKMSGEQTELDKTVMEKIGDPMVHLVRNSLDHGIESPEVRKAAGKPEVGTIHLNAFHQGGNIVIEIIDDGAGLNTDKILQKAREKGLVREDETLSEEKIHDLIFQAGFSTVDEVSDVSGRGVGMDVVKRNIRDLGGVVEVKSLRGQGSTFTIRLPLTLAILDGQLIRVGKQTYIISLVSIVESLLINPKQCNSIAGRLEMYRLRDDYIPIIRLYELFNIKADNTEINNGLLVVVEAEGQKAGILVDDLLAQQQVVIKSLETNYQKVQGISGATILGDGTVAMILDISGLITLSRQKMSSSGLSESNLKLIENTGSKAA